MQFKEKIKQKLVSDVIPRGILIQINILLHVKIVIKCFNFLLKIKQCRTPFQSGVSKRREEGIHLT